MVTLQEKVEALGLLEVDTNPLVIAELYQLRKIKPGKHLKYYKQHGKEFMYYSVEYLNRTPIDQLLFKDTCNQIQFVEG